MSDTIETEAEKGETAKKGWLSRLRSGLAKSIESSPFFKSAF